MRIIHWPDFFLIFSPLVLLICGFDVMYFWWEWTAAKSNGIILLAAFVYSCYIARV